MKIKYFIIPASFIVLVSLVLIDTSGYRAALNDFVTSNSSEILYASNKAMERDLDRWAKCNNKRTKNDYEYTSDARTCFIAAMSETKTTIASITLATSASKWLIEHPDDKELREAALAALELGRKDLLDTKQRYYDKLEKIADESNSSFVYRWVNGKQDGSKLFHSMITMLDNAEYSVRLPDVVKRQSEWKLMAITGRH